MNASLENLSLVDKQIDKSNDKQHPECYEICIESIEEQYFGHLIGKHGLRIKEIKSKFNDEVEITIIGKRIYIRASNQTNAIDCERLMNKLVDEYKEKGFLKKDSVNSQFNKIRENPKNQKKKPKSQKKKPKSQKKKTKLGLFIDYKFHGSLLDRNNSVIKAITQKHIKIRSSKIDSQNNNVFITG